MGYLLNSEEKNVRLQDIIAKGSRVKLAETLKVLDSLLIVLNHAGLHTTALSIESVMGSRNEFLSTPEQQQATDRLYYDICIQLGADMRDIVKNGKQ